MCCFFSLRGVVSGFRVATCWLGIVVVMFTLLVRLALGFVLLLGHVAAYVASLTLLAMLLLGGFGFGPVNGFVEIAGAFAGWGAGLLLMDWIDGLALAVLGASE